MKFSNNIRNFLKYFLVLSCSAGVLGLTLPQKLLHTSAQTFGIAGMKQDKKPWRYGTLRHSHYFGTNSSNSYYKLPVFNWKKVKQQNVSIKPSIETKWYQTQDEGGSHIDFNPSIMKGYQSDDGAGDNYRSVSKTDVTVDNTYKNDMYGYFNGLGQGDDEGSPYHGTKDRDIYNEGRNSSTFDLDHFGSGRYHGYLALNDLMHHPYIYNRHNGWGRPGNYFYYKMGLDSDTHVHSGDDHQIPYSLKVSWMHPEALNNRAIYVDYPHGAKVNVNTKHGIKPEYVDVVLRISNIEPYRPWRGDNQVTNKGPYSIILSHNIAHGLYYNGITHMHVSYLFFKRNTNYTEQISVPQSYMQLGPIFPLSKYGHARVKGQDDATNNMGHTRFYDANTVHLYGKHPHLHLLNYDPTGESIAPGLGNKEWVPHKNSIIRAYHSKIIRPHNSEPYAVGGLIGLRSHGGNGKHGNADVIIPSTLGAHTHKYIFDIDVGSALGYNAFSPNTKMIKPKKPQHCTYIHYIDAQSGYTLDEIKAGKTKMHEITKKGQNQNKFWINFYNYIKNWDSYYKLGPGSGYSIAPDKDLGSNARKIANAAQSSKNSGYEKWSNFSNGNHKIVDLSDGKKCHDLYVFMERPKPKPVPPKQNTEGVVNKTLLQRKYPGSKYYVPVKGYPTPNNDSNMEIPDGDTAQTQYGSKKYAYLLWGTFPNKTRTVTIVIPKLYYWKDEHGNKYWSEYFEEPQFMLHPYRHANIMLHDDIGYSNSNGNYGSGDTPNGDTDSSGRPNDKPYASITYIKRLKAHTPKPNSDYRTSNKFEIDLNQDSPDKKDRVSRYAGKPFAYRLDIQVGENKANKQKMLLPGISGSYKGDNAKCASWNDYGNDKNNFKWWNHAYMNWHLRDFTSGKPKSWDTTNNYLNQQVNWALAGGQHHLNSGGDTDAFNNSQESYYQSHIKPSTHLVYGETQSNYVPLEIPMIHYNVYHYNFGNNSQTKIPSNIIQNAGNNDSWHKNFKDKFITPTKTGRRQGWFMRDWGFGYAGQKVRVPIVPSIPNNAKKTDDDYSSDIANCSKGLNKNDLTTHPDSEINNYQFAYKESPKYRKPFETIKVGDNGSMKPDKSGAWKNHTQKFYKPYDKPQMAMDMGRLIVDTDNKQNVNSTQSSQNGLPFWLEFQTDPTRWTPSYNGDKHDKLSGLRDDFKNTNIKMTITDPTDSDKTTKTLFTVQYPAYRDGDSNPKNLIGINNGHIVPKNVPVPMNGYTSDNHGILSLKGNELSRYQKGDAIPLRLKITAVPRTQGKPYADFWDPAHYSEGYIATDDTIKANDFKHLDGNDNRIIGADSGKHDNSADNSSNKYHHKITGEYSTIDRDISTRNMTGVKNVNTTKSVMIQQPERTIKYLAGNIAGNSTGNPQLQYLGAENRDSTTSHDPTIRIQDEWLRVQQNNRRPYVINVNNANSDYNKPHLITVKDGIRDVVKVPGHSTINLSNDKAGRKWLRDNSYAVVYPATFKTGYGIHPDITVSYGGNVQTSNYMERGNKVDFAFPSEWGTNGGDSIADTPVSEKDNDIVIHNHGGASDKAHIGSNTRDFDDEHSLALSNHSANDPTTRITTPDDLKKGAPYRSDNNSAMTAEKYPQITDSYNGASAWPTAKSIDMEFDKTLHAFKNGSGTINSNLPIIPTDAGKYKVTYQFPAQDLSNADGSGTDIANDKDHQNNMMNGLDKNTVPKKIYKLFTPAWLPLGNYQTVFERNLRSAKRLGGNWLDFEIGRPDTAIAHMMLSDTNPEDAHSSQFNGVNDKIRKKGKYGYADEQLRDELSLQPVMTRQITKYKPSSDFPTSNKAMKDMFGNGTNQWPWIELQ